MRRQSDYAGQINWIEKPVHGLFAHSRGTSVNRVLPKIAFFLSRQHVPLRYHLSRMTDALARLLAF